MKASLLSAFSVTGLDNYGKFGPFEPFMLVSPYRTAAASPTGTISRLDAMVLN